MNRKFESVSEQRESGNGGPQDRMPVKPTPRTVNIIQACQVISTNSMKRIESFLSN